MKTTAICWPILTLYLLIKWKPRAMHSKLIAADDGSTVEFSWNAGEKKLLFIND